MIKKTECIQKVEKHNLKECEEIHIYIMDSSNNKISLKLWTNIYKTVSCEIEHHFDVLRLHNVSMAELDILLGYVLDRNKPYSTKKLKPYLYRKGTNTEKVAKVKERLNENR